MCWMGSAFRVISASSFLQTRTCGHLVWELSSRANTDLSPRPRVLLLLPLDLPSKHLSLYLLQRSPISTAKSVKKALSRNFSTVSEWNVYSHKKSLVRAHSPPPLPPMQSRVIRRGRIEPDNGGRATSTYCLPAEGRRQCESRRYRPSGRCQPRQLS